MVYAVLSLMMHCAKSEQNSRSSPVNANISRFYYSYRDVACTIYPVVPECNRFEETLDMMLANRTKTQRENLQLDPTRPLGISLPYLSLMFAVLASGAQCSGIRAKERELTSQVYSEQPHLPSRPHSNHPQHAARIKHSEWQTS